MSTHPNNEREINLKALGFTVLNVTDTATVHVALSDLRSLIFGKMHFSVLKTA